MDVVVLARLTELPPKRVEGDDNAVPRAKFEITRLLKGESIAKPKEIIETLYFGDAKPGKMFLVMGIDPPKVMWSTPLPLTERAQDYLAQVITLPKDGAKRYHFFQDYLEDEDEMLARDAYDEFAKASYDTVKSLKAEMKHDQLVEWIKNPNIPASRRRLYLVMLGICGSEQDLPMLEKYIKSDDRKAKQGLDALIACYLTLKGEAGMQLVEDLFLKNSKSDYADTYACIMALRFHATEGKILEKQRLLEGLRHMLDRPELADLVIPDLARWEDWSSMDKLFELYKKADDKTSWVRVPVVNYLRVCPLPKAKELLKQCEKIDPQSVKRANTFFPTAPTAQPVNPDKASQIKARPSKTQPASIDIPSALPVAFNAPVPIPDEDEGPAAPLAGESGTAKSGPVEVASAAAATEEVTSVNRGAAAAAAIKQNPTPVPNLWQLIGVPVAAGIGLMLVQWSLLRGGVGPRMSRDDNRSR